MQPLYHPQSNRIHGTSEAFGTGSSASPRFLNLQNGSRLPQRTSYLHRNLIHSPNFRRRGERNHQHCDHDPYVGAEPGVNPRSGASNHEYSHFKQSCVIDIIDYDSEETTFLRMGNDQFIHTMKELAASRTQNTEGGSGGEPALPPLAVRWINIGGIDWNVLRAVALQYDLHSLALEDILHESGHNQSKADYYPEHLFIRILNHTLAPDYEEEEEEDRDYVPEPLVNPPAAPDPDPAMLKDSISPSDSGTTAPSPRVQSLSGLVDAAKEEIALSSSTNTSAPSLSNLQVLANGLTYSDSASVKDELEVETSHPLVVNQKRKSRGRRLLSSAKNALTRRMTALSGHHSQARQEVIIRIRELKKNYRVNVRHHPLFIFLLRNGTVISIHPSPNLDYSAPITERLHQEDSVLRTSNDASLLVQSLIDLSVDRVLEVMDEYQGKIHDLEHKILMNPSMETVRSLHILSGDLIMHKRTLEPIKTMIFGLRKYDLDRCIALSDNLELAKQQQQEFEEKRRRGKKAKRHEGRHEGRLKGSSHRAEVAAGLETPHVEDAHHGSPGNVRSDDEHLRHFMRMKASQGQLPTHSQGYFSYKAKVYLADVYDHMDFALTSLDMFAGISENLINYAFNMASYEMNIVMSRLTLVSIIFLPLTLLTGYFGMNFTPFWAVEKNSDAFFWKVAAPMMAVLVPLFMFQEIKRIFTYVKRRWQDRQAMNSLVRELKKPNSQLWYDLQA